MKVKVYITLKSGVLDPQGKAIADALHSLGFAEVGTVRQGKYIEIDVEEGTADHVRARVEAMCHAVLANTVIEEYRIEAA